MTDESDETCPICGSGDVLVFDSYVDCLACDRQIPLA